MEYCNISSHGIRLRLTQGVLSTIAAVWAAALFLLIERGEMHGLLLTFTFFATLSAAIGFLQAKLKFCVAFSFLQLKELNEKGQLEQADPQYRREYLIYSIRILLYALAIAVVTTVVVHLLKIYF